MLKWKTAGVEIVCLDLLYLSVDKDKSMRPVYQCRVWQLSLMRLNTLKTIAVLVLSFWYTQFSIYAKLAHHPSLSLNLPEAEP